MTIKANNCDAFIKGKNTSEYTGKKEITPIKRAKSTNEMYKTKAGFLFCKNGFGKREIVWSVSILLIKIRINLQ